MILGQSIRPASFVWSAFWYIPLIFVVPSADHHVRRRVLKSFLVHITNAFRLRSFLDIRSGPISSGDRTVDVPSGTVPKETRKLWRNGPTQPDARRRILLAWTIPPGAPSANFHGLLHPRRALRWRFSHGVVRPK